MTVATEVAALREALNRAKDERGVTPKDIAEAGAVPSFSTVYRFINGEGASLGTVLAIEQGWLIIQAKMDDVKKQLAKGKK